jgi:NFACT N-terminal and middle domains/NFACT protein RNA binding domain
MSEGVAALLGLPITGVIGLSPRSLAIAFGARPRTYLWLHIEPKEARYAAAPELPIDPDPRGSRFGALEDFLRGLTLADVTGVGEPEGELRLALAREGAVESRRLALVRESRRVNLVLTEEPDGQVLWALHRERESAGRRAAEISPGDTPHPPPRPPRVRAVLSDGERETLRAAIAASFREDFERELERELKAAERSLARRFEAQGGDLERARAQQSARRRGEILLAHYLEIPRGASRVRLPDPFADSPEASVEIDLDPKLTTHENAARLFQQAKKGERGQMLVETRLTRTRSSLADLERLRRELPGLKPRDTLERLSSFLEAARLKPMARGDAQKIRLGRQTRGAPRALRPGHRSPGARESIRPRTLVTSDGWEVWIGRNNAENDLITHRLSNPHDLWFHVVGVPGSHVILRRPSRNAIPKPRTLEEAASIAAYFSKARKLTRVPVIYTERKFVSKPRRSKPGLALCTRERELLVRPRLPKANAGDANEREVSS